MNRSFEYILIIVFILLVTCWTFINTIITKKWRNRAPKESESWKWGIFYYNPLDKRIMLPKRTGLGYTFNFARPISVMFTLALIILIVYIMITSPGK